MIDRARACIECFGPPGVGKTHVASALVDVLGSRDIRVQDDGLRIAALSRPVRVLKKLRCIAPAVPHLATHFGGTLRAGARVRWRGASSGSKVVFNWAFILSLVRAQRQRDGIPVHSQALLQALWSTIYHSRKGFNGKARLGYCLDSTLAFLGHPRLIVLNVIASEERIRQRLRRRGSTTSGRYEQPLSAQEWHWVRSATDRVLELSHWLSERRGDNTHIVRIDNTRNDPAGTVLKDELTKRVIPLLADVDRDSTGTRSPD